MFCLGKLTDDSEYPYIPKGLLNENDYYLIMTVVTRSGVRGALCFD